MRKKKRPIFPIVLISAFMLLVVTVVVVTLLSDNQTESQILNGNQENKQATALQERDYILLAGFRLRQSFVNEVQEYNRRNPENQIVTHDYWDINDDTGFRQAIDRLHFELLSGNIPDIILFEGTDDADLLRVRESLVKQGMLSDLYPFIDADPVLSREDFFLNVLRGYENTEGSLFAIGNWLSITTMVTTNPSLQINDWTVNAFLDLMEQSIAAGNPEPLGSTMTDITFLTTMLELIGSDFINFKTGICSFESDNFIRLLELAANIPPNPEFEGWGVNWVPDFNALHSGNQVVDMIGFAGLPNWTDGSGNSLTTEVFNYIGLPSSSGGVHSVQIHGTLSIFESSQYPDEAWQFIREELFSGATWEGALTLRKDDFENRLSASNMTTPEKNAINVLMNQAVVFRPLSGTILMIVEEDFTAFSRGNRTAAETARIIQSRAQIYLHERS